MRNPAGRNVFREFLRTEYSEENMLFWLACEDLKQELNKNVVEEKARSIYEDYISILSPKEVRELRTCPHVIRWSQDRTQTSACVSVCVHTHTLRGDDVIPRAGFGRCDEFARCRV